MVQNLLAQFRVLADGGYPGAGPLYIPFSARVAIYSRILRRYVVSLTTLLPTLFTTIGHRYNRRLSRNRVIVEQIIRKVKKWRAVKEQSRYRRYFFALTMKATACLYNRRVRLGQRV